jgi:hypothetical protein
MPVRDLGTVRETVPRGQPPPPLDRRLSARLLGCLSLVEERQSSAEWHRDLLAVELACVLACVLLATVSLLQAGDVLEGLDGHDGVVKLQITDKPHVSPCAANPYTTILSSHAPVRFRAAATGATFVGCGWTGWMPSLRTAAGIVLPLVLLRYVLRFACLAAVNTGDLRSAVGIGHGALRHDHGNTVAVAILAVLVSMMMLSVTFIDLRAVLSARTWCRNGLRGAEMVVKGVPFTKGAGVTAGSIVCSNGVFFWQIGVDVFATACWILSARMHIDFYMRDIYDPPPPEVTSPQRVAATVGVTTGGIGQTARYPEVRGGGGRGSRSDGSGPGTAAAAAAAGGGGGGGSGGGDGSGGKGRAQGVVLPKEQDPRSWKKMPV